MTLLFSHFRTLPAAPERLAASAVLLQVGTQPRKTHKKKFGTIPTRTFRHLRLYIPVEDGHRIAQQLKLGVRHLQTLPPPPLGLQPQIVYDLIDLITGKKINRR